MATDLTVVLENRPGRLADVAEALGKAGVNIEGLLAGTDYSTGTVHLLVEDPDAASEALTAAGIGVGNPKEVLVLDVENKPGAMGIVCRKVADAGVNIELAYFATNNRLMLAVNDVEKAKAAL